MTDIADEVSRLVHLKSNDNWASSTRTDAHYDLVKREYSFGQRMSYVPKRNERYVDLQSSRSIGINLGDDEAAIMAKSHAAVESLHEHDMIRISELVEQGIEPKVGFAEIGFRLPRLMKHYGSLHGIKTVGYDVVPLSVSVARRMGFDCHLHDMSDESSILDLSGCDLVVCYHVLEHLFDPAVGARKLHAAMDSGACLHVEIPIEPGLPRLQSAHLFAFEPNDLAYMMHEAGFVVKTKSTATHAGGPPVERYLCQKE